MKKKNILVTGGSGYAGSNISIFLKKKHKNSKIHSLDNLSHKSSKLNHKRLLKYRIKNKIRDLYRKCIPVKCYTRCIWPR